MIINNYQKQKSRDIFQATKDPLEAKRYKIYLKELGLTLAEIALLLADRDQGVLDEKALQQLASNVLAKINERIASLQVIRDYVEPVAIGDMRVLNEPDCSFVVEFMTALKVTKLKC